MSRQVQGSLSLAITGVEDLLADSLAFRAGIGADDADDARGRIHYCELLELDIALQSLPRPCAIIIPESHGYEQFGQGSSNDLGARGGIVAILTKHAAKTEDPKDLVLDFTNWLGGILDDCAEKVGGDYFPFRTIEVIEGPARSDLNERATDDFWLAAVLFSHNINP